MNLIRLLLATAVCAMTTSASFAGGLCCKICGEDGECRKVCRLECTEKKIATTCWSFKEEDFCLPLPSHPTCSHEECVCDDCDPDAPKPHFPTIRFWREWSPAACGKVFTRRKLMKKTVTKTVPSYKWVVEELCPACEANCPVVAPPDHVLIPPAPAIENVPIIGGHTPPATKR